MWCCLWLLDTYLLRFLYFDSVCILFLKTLSYLTKDGSWCPTQGKILDGKISLLIIIFFKYKVDVQYCIHFRFIAKWIRYQFSSVAQSCLTLCDPVCVCVYIYTYIYNLTSVFHTVHEVLEARTLKWFAIPFSNGPHFVRTLHHDLSIFGGPARYDS